MPLGQYHGVISWPLDPTVYAGLVVLYFGHAWLARGLDDVERKHSLYFGLGLLVLWLALESPLDTIADHYLDSVHMFQHVLLGFVAPPLMVLGLSQGMVARLVRVPGVRAITEPVPAQIIAGTVMIGWHLPALYNATLYSESLHIVEHLAFIAAGVLIYWPILHATSAHAGWQMSPGAKLLYMLVATLPQDAVALALIFSRVPFYEYYTHAPRLIASLNPLTDQTVAGAVLMTFGKATISIAAIAVFIRWFGGEHEADQALLATSAVGQDDAR
ncbi:MAG: cytochrome c oxidase assembly protein [Candidatus Dormibacteraeota bacterium]|nr:cytochrome c oxidase assembly protein [Candidatus Dormibacteraeota bacterium]